MMTDAQKVQLAVDMCLKRAAESESDHDKVMYMLWAKLLPPVAEWEQVLKTDFPVLQGHSYLNAALGVAATFITQCMRNVSNNDPEILKLLGPSMTASFAKMLHRNISEGTTVAQMGKSDA